MAFTIAVRQGPARLATQLTKTAVFRSSGAPARAFHKGATKPSFFTSRVSTSALRAAGPGNALAKAPSRGYQYQSSAPPVDSASTMRRLLTGGAIFGGTLVAINAVFNRETREDGGMPLYEREFLNSTFMHTGLGIGIIGLTARQMVQTGFVYRIMVTNPWAVAIGGMALSFGTMMGTRAIEPEK